MLEIKNLYAGYGDTMVLRGTSMQARAGEITTILGRNGCGKTTLLKALIGALPIKAGEVDVDGITAAELTVGERAQKLAYLPQSKSVPDITAGRFVLHGRFPYLSYPRRYTAKDCRIAEKAMEEMGISDLWEVPVAELSGGMRQKVYIAMALAKQAPIILMDEPTSYLDIGQQLRFAETVKALAAQGKTVLLVLHDILLALKISDRICVMENGTILQQGTSEEILQRGVLHRLYGIEIGTAVTESGLQYYYKSKPLV